MDNIIFVVFYSTFMDSTLSEVRGYYQNYNIQEIQQGSTLIEYDIYDMDQDKEHSFSNQSFSSVSNIASIIDKKEDINNGDNVFESVLFQKNINGYPHYIMIRNRNYESLFGQERNIIGNYQTEVFAYSESQNEFNKISILEGPLDIYKRNIEDEGIIGLEYGDGYLNYYFYFYGINDKSL